MSEEPRRAAEGNTPEKEPTRLEKAKKAYDVVSDIVTPTRLLVAAAALLVLVVGLVGGWDKVAAVETVVPTATPSVATTATPFEFTVKRARHGMALQPIAYEQEDLRYLFVTADVTLRSDQPVDVGVLADAISIDAKGLDAGFGTVATAAIYRMSDALGQRMLQPNITTPLVFIWRQSLTEPVPTELTVTLKQHVWMKSTLEDYTYWQQPTTVAELTLPVEELEPEQ